MILYNVTDEYINFLSKTDRKVLSSHQADRRFERPHLGIVVENSSMNYFIPLSSPDNQDYINGQIRNSTITIKRLITPRNDFVGKLLINNMIPVPASEIKPIDMDISNKTPEELRYI